MNLGSLGTGQLRQDVSQTGRTSGGDRQDSSETGHSTEHFWIPGGDGGGWGGQPKETRWLIGGGDLSVRQSHKKQAWHGLGRA